MLALTRRRYPERENCWFVYYGDVHAGTIAQRTGNPLDTVPWEWRCGFYPGSEPGDCSNGTAETFDEARVAFEDAWQRFLSNRTAADFQEWRDQRDRTAAKYAAWERRERFPSQMPSSLMRCPCGETFDSHKLEYTMIHVPHITAAHATDGIHR
jgi:hypothetical protein